MAVRRKGLSRPPRKTKGIRCDGVDMPGKDCACQAHLDLLTCFLPSDRRSPQLPAVWLPLCSEEEGGWVLPLT